MPNVWDFDLWHSFDSWILKFVIELAAYPFSLRYPPSFYCILDSVYCILSYFILPKYARSLSCVFLVPMATIIFLA